MISEEKQEHYDKLLQEIAAISNLNHDLNNHLTIVSLSIGRIRKCGIKYGDEKLLKTAFQLEEFLINIEKTLTKLKPLKNNALVKEFIEKNVGQE